jgi:hypothetical protein
LHLAEARADVGVNFGAEIKKVQAEAESTLPKQRRSTEARVVSWSKAAACYD